MLQLLLHRCWRVNMDHWLKCGSSLKSDYGKTGAFPLHQPTAHGQPRFRYTSRSRLWLVLKSTVKTCSTSSLNSKGETPCVRFLSQTSHEGRAAAGHGAMQLAVGFRELEGHATIRKNEQTLPGMSETKLSLQSWRRAWFRNSHELRVCFNLPGDLTVCCSTHSITCEPRHGHHVRGVINLIRNSLHRQN